MISDCLTNFILYANLIDTVEYEKFSGANYGLVNYIDTQAKCSHLKKIDL